MRVSPAHSTLFQVHATSHIQPRELCNAYYAIRCNVNIVTPSRGFAAGVKPQGVQVVGALSAPTKQTGQTSHPASSGIVQGALLGHVAAPQSSKREYHHAYTGAVRHRLQVDHAITTTLSSCRHSSITSEKTSCVCSTSTNYKQQVSPSQHAMLTIKAKKADGPNSGCCHLQSLSRAAWYSYCSVSYQ